MADWWYVAAQLPPEARKEIAQWVTEQTWPEGTTLKHEDTYHVTTIYSYDGRDRLTADEFDDLRSPWVFNVATRGVETFTDARTPMQPVVITLSAFLLSRIVEIHLTTLESMGFKVSRFEGGYKPHITVAMIPQETSFEAEPPWLTFRLEKEAVIGGYDR